MAQLAENGDLPVALGLFAAALAGGAAARSSVGNGWHHLGCHVRPSDVAELASRGFGR